MQNTACQHQKEIDHLRNNLKVQGHFITDIDKRVAINAEKFHFIDEKFSFINEKLNHIENRLDKTINLISELNKEINSNIDYLNKEINSYKGADAAKKYIISMFIALITVIAALGLHKYLGL